ncbi:MAG: polymer-forming cytoskeletal protein [Treponema sp.]|nr:polymer-forming cytoskeletal protein [Treponema sp.]
MSRQDKKAAESSVVTLGKLTVLKGRIRFSKTLRVLGRLEGTVEAAFGNLIVEKGATVSADRIDVTSLTVYGKVVGNVFAQGKVDMMSGATVEGDVMAAKLRIADGVLFKGQCSMTGAEDEPEIFSRPIEEIKAELERTPPRER